jgi:tetratricopeptide (TPR) repeat protein
VRWSAFAALAVAAGVAAAEPTPDPEVARSVPAVDVPAIGDLRVPELAHGARSPLELRVRGTPLLHSKVTVAGYIVFIYDCVADVRAAGESIAAAQARIDADPTLCQRPRFFLGDSATTSPDEALWIVDVPRAPNKLERQNLPPSELKKMFPSPPPKIAVGDYVEVTGDFEQTSAHGDANSDGLVSFGSIVHVSAPASPKLGPIASDALMATPTPPAAHPGAAPTAQARAESIRHANDGAKAMGTKQFDVALDEEGKAVALWPGNALAWYGLGAAHAQRAEWPDASAAFAHAADIAPDVPMYQMWAGVSAYEAAAATKPAHASYDAAERALLLAVQLEPKLWRAHLYLGRIARASGRWHTAASELGDALRANPRELAPYVALAELYSKWEQPQLAAKVALIGTTNVPGSQATDAWYELGRALDDQGKLADAIDAYTHAIDAGGSPLASTFARGQASFRRGKLDDAKRDLEAYVARPDAAPFAAMQARKMLAAIADKAAHT